MKQTIFHLLLPLVLLSSCQQEELPGTDAGYGYLAIADVSVQTVNVNTIRTRSVADDLSLRGEIWQDGKKVKELSQEELSQTIRQKTGDFTLKIFSQSYTEYAGWTNADLGEPVYYAEQPFTITEVDTNRVAVELPMINFGVSLSLPEGFDTWFKTYAFTAQVGERTVALQTGQTAYFPHAEGATLAYTLEATNTDDETSQETGTYGGADTGEALQPNTLYTVTYDFQTNQLKMD